MCPSYFLKFFYFYFFPPEVPERNPWNFFSRRSRRGTLETLLLVFSSSSSFVVRRVSMGILETDTWPEQDHKRENTLAQTFEYWESFVDRWNYSRGVDKMMQAAIDAMTRALPSSLAHQFSVACSLINIATSIGPYIVEFAKSHLACLRIPIWSVLLQFGIFTCWLWKSAADHRGKKKGLWTNDVCRRGNLALEWGEFGIRCNCVAPGPIADTPGLEKLSVLVAHSHMFHVWNIYHYLPTFIYLKKIGKYM